MKSNKTDHRSKYTRLVINEGLLKLLTEKPLNKISVAELCAASGINRGTFYNHFYDVFDVYESIENQFYDEVKARLENIKVHDFNRPLFKEIMLLIYRNADLVRVLLSDKTNSDFLSRIIGFVRDKFVKEWPESNKEISASFMNEIFSYTVNGALGVISDWVQTGMKQPLDEISELIVELNEIIISAYIK